ncbi:hypothetical protein [Streptomyces cucumeris]|uniref:hypothetical protein n=1 Tax=Streptomyces cucumeris TaxID=2962890 RepID=UPI0020C8C462|nr:hypothetical protein [Streptomyces sp. NEAU-Y11]MCP9209606.1 hypothetical protein [Streptomyces sp. NEAU-Y11]
MAQIDVSEVRGLVRVGEASDEKGNPVGVLEVLGIPVLYANKGDLDRYGHADWRGMFEQRLARLLSRGLVGEDDPRWWAPDSPTGREVGPIQFSDEE